MKHSSFFRTHNPMTNLYLLLSWKTMASVVGGWLISFILPVKEFLILTLFFVVCDLITGTRAAKKRKEEIHSRGLRRTVEKLVLYFIAILASEGLRVVFMPMVPVTYMAALAIAMTEFKSNMENIETVTGVTIWDYVSKKINAFFNSNT